MMLRAVHRTCADPERTPDGRMTLSDISANETRPTGAGFGRVRFSGKYHITSSLGRSGRARAKLDTVEVEPEYCAPVIFLGFRGGLVVRCNVRAADLVSP